uniref:E3 ubiquitin-protein ligase n=2 Tax=Myripristis murdjan TaxID=586833 RepID=A0A668A6E8_9TELE
MSCPLLAPDLPQDAGEKLKKFLSKHPGVQVGGKSGAWRISGLPETLGPAVDELEKILGGPVLKEEDKQRIQYSRHTTSNGGAVMEGGATAGSTTGGNEEEDTCSICMDTFTNKKKIKCSHEFCEECLTQLVNSMGPICPLCKTVFGKMEGDQPDGTMSWIAHRHPLPGFPDCGSIVITYNIPSGTQMAKHPNPGQPHIGVIRAAYLPDNREGREVLQLLRRAFDQKLIFTVGTSRNTGGSDQVIWNDIEHKTYTYGGPLKFGYPDPGYLGRVREKLKAKGIE